MTKDEAIKKQNGYEENVEFLTWSNNQERAVAMQKYSSTANEFDSVQTSSMHATSYINNFSDLDPYSSSRPGMTRNDYSQFRPHEAIPSKISDIIKYADKTYHEVGIVRNIIDLMGDFACQGIRLSHTDQRVEKFYKNWFSKVNGADRSERFSNLLFRLANVIIRRQNATIDLKQRARLFRTSADMEVPLLNVEKNKIPIHYTFLHPCTLEVIGGDLSTFTNKRAFAIKLPMKLKQVIQNPSTPKEKEMVASLPNDMKQAAKTGNPYPLPTEDTLSFYYKKDDWEVWAYPMLHAITKDIILLDKLKLADIAALDGAISNIRIFKLGSLEHNLAPGRGLPTKLKNILSKQTGVGTIDLIWGPDIEIVESKTEVHKFLGEEKYKPTLNSIFGGLGIPQTLTGFGSGGTTNNFISLKTLIQRLKYVRSILIEFWSTEIAIVQEAMSFEEPAQIEFDYPDLGDSESEKNLLIQLADRNLISNELLMEKFSHNNIVENARIKREYDAIESEKVPPKYGPFINAQTEDDLAKIALQQGRVDPEQVGVDLEFGKSKPIPKPTAGIGVPGAKKPKGQPQKGRPKGANDTTKRKTKVFKPKSKASIELWAKTAQDDITELLYNPILRIFNKKNIRSLTDQEHAAAEEIKFNILLRLEPLSKIDNTTVGFAFKDYMENKAELADVNEYYKTAVADIASDLKRQPTLPELRDIQAKIYTNIQEIEDDN